MTSGNDPKNLVPISVRHSVIKTWVYCKQLLSQQIPKNLGHDSEVGDEKLVKQKVQKSGSDLTRCW